jgi:hypothetical protein
MGSSWGRECRTNIEKVLIETPDGRGSGWQRAQKGCVVEVKDNEGDETGKGPKRYAPPEVERVMLVWHALLLTTETRIEKWAGSPRFLAWSVVISDVTSAMHTLKALTGRASNEAWRIASETTVRMWKNLTTAMVMRRRGGTKECIESLGGGREEGEKKREVRTRKCIELRVCTRRMDGRWLKGRLAVGWGKFVCRRPDGRKLEFGRRSCEITEEKKGHERRKKKNGNAKTKKKEEKKKSPMKSDK